MILGFASLQLKAGPYLYNIHAKPGHRGRGIGRALMRGAARWALTCGQSRYPHALEPNRAARAFYARLGVIEGPGFEEELFGQPVTTVPVRWPDRAALRGLAARG